MTYSKVTILIVILLFFGSLVTGAALIWWRTDKEPENFLLPKLLGYSLLAAFRFNLNTLALPLGIIVAYILTKKAKQNKKAKTHALFLGGFLFLTSFLPVQDPVEQLLYPRDNIRTYLHEKITNQAGFNLSITSRDRKFTTFLTEKNDMGIRLYEELRHSTKTSQVNITEEWELSIGQDFPDDRFRFLQFVLDTKGEYMYLTIENRLYYFKTSPEFQRLFADAIKNIKMGYIPIQKSDGRTIVFTTKELEFVNPMDQRRIASGEIISANADYSNIFLDSRPLLDTKEYEELRQRVFEAERYKGENKHYLYYVLDPYPVKGGKEIVFTSNKNTVLTATDKLNVHIINFDGTGEKILIDAEKYGSAKILDTIGYLVFASGLDKNSLLVANANTGEVKEFLVNGHLDAVARDGSHVLFRKIKDAYILPELWIVNIATGEETMIGNQPKDYFFNKGQK